MTHVIHPLLVTHSLLCAATVLLIEVKSVNILHNPSNRSQSTHYLQHYDVCYTHSWQYKVELYLVNLINHLNRAREHECTFIPC